VKYIDIPIECADKDYKRILDEVVKCPKTSLVLIQGGFLGVLLGFDLINKGYRVIDIGRLNVGEL
jgi:hypothetical protein